MMGLNLLGESLDILLKVHTEACKGVPDAT